MSPGGDSTSLSLLGALVVGGTGDDWARFYARYAPLIARWCRARGLQQADGEDVTAEVMRKLIDGIKRYDREAGGPTSRFRDWLRAVVRNAIADHFRRLCPDRGSGDSGAAAVLAAVEAGAPDAAVEELIANLGDHLDDDLLGAFETVRGRHAGSQSWRAYELVCLNGLEIAAAAANLDTTPAAVSSAAYRVRKDMLAELRRRIAGGDDAPTRPPA